MKSETVRYTATLPQAYVDELKEMAKINMIPSVNFAINEALDKYLKSHKAAQYEALMREAGQDEAFLGRTVCCSNDFAMADSEVSGTW